MLCKVLGLFVVNGYEIVYPFQADGAGNKRELSTGIKGMHDDCNFCIKLSTE